MDSASLTSSAMLEQWNALQNVWQPVPMKVNVESKTMKLDPYPSDPTRLLAAGKQFKVTVTTGAENLAGIPLGSSKSWTFTITADATAPRVSKVTPAGRKTGVSRSTNITATFSEKMDKRTVANPDNFTLTKQGSSTHVAFTSILCCTNGNMVTFDPGSTLEANTIYKATIKGGVTGAKDLVGNALQQDYSWSFTTGG
jgi:hypothetical protein